MTKDLAYFQSFTKELIERDADLRKLQYKYEAISQLNYTLPEPLETLSWVVPYKSSVPYVALKGGTRALSSLDERINIHPITVSGVVSDDASMTAEQVANNWETALKWEMSRATARQPNYRQSVIWNALVYDELVGTCIHLPTQIKSLKALERDTNRHEAAMRHGFFAMKLYDPKQVHHYFSDYMLEAVALVTVMKAQQIVDFWGKQAEEINEKIKGDPVHAMQDYLLADVHTLDNRVVWAQEGDDETTISAGGGIEILPVQDNPHPFIPWAIKVGGTNTESKVEHRRKPLLYPVVMAEQWFIANVVGTLGLSQAISESNAPLHEVSGAGGRNVRIDHREPGGVIYTQQHQTYTRLQRGDIDPAIQGFLEKFEADMNRSTLPAVLVTSEAMPGESYSGYNLRVQTAIGALIPYKALGEQFYDEQFRNMLLHTHYSGEDLVGYGKKGDKALQKYTIGSEEIDPNGIVLNTELSPDVPVDRVQKINSAIQMAERLNYSPIKILEYLGESDPYGALQDWISWQFVNAKVAGRIQKIAAIESGALEKMAEDIADMKIQAMMKQADAAKKAKANGGSGGRGNGRQMNLFGGERAGMDRNNPAMGGQAPIVEMGDEATFEGATGESRGMGGGV